MRLIRFHTYGGPEVLTLDRAPVPAPGEGELLVKVSAIGVTLPVVRLTRGVPDGTGVPLPHVPGGDVVGTVASVGAGVTGYAVGDRVAALAFTGAYAEYVVVPAAFAAPVPDGITDESAVHLVRGGQVALGVLRASGLQDGESVLVTAAAGGVGHLAVQLAAVAGAGRVVAAIGPTAASTKAAALRSLGVDEVVTYEELSAGRAGQVDVVLDGVGGDVQRACLASLAPLGRLVAFSGAGVTVDVNELRMHARTIIGFAMAHHAGGRRETYARHRRELWDLSLEGRLRPLVHDVLPLERACEAHRIVEGRGNVGRVLLRPGARC
ncbi:quinone oxidoreductase family protein [Pseudonocardia sp. CA-142604]|uniref:quinone oxidoreductase family protein n=1 Tax=Pseudonocardia sp. CA-142604 TaxID=3240024 RepID=UPI003D8D5918